MDVLTFLNNNIAEISEELVRANDEIYGYAELSYEEVQSMYALTEILEREGFQAEIGLAEMPTCFTGTAVIGTGKPVIGILGEFDALDKLSQEAGNPVKAPIVEGAPGHGCGHCCLGTGALGAAILLKKYLEAVGLNGTVIYYGCPAEEGAGSKQFMARAGLFDCCDFVYTWHPSNFNDVSNSSSTAIMGANFIFDGKTAHAGGSPWLGRSALDAAELMSVGCNYLREHIRDGERVHYAYSDAGGTAPNVVPDHAVVKYEVRSQTVKGMLALFDRVVKVAQGAAMMTETEMHYELTMAFSDSRNNSVLAEIASAALQEVGAPAWDEEDFKLAKAFIDSFDEVTRDSIRESLGQKFGAEKLDEIMENPLHTEVIPYDKEHLEFKGGSSDVGDVTYTVPTCELHVATAAMGTVGHTWQMAGQAGSSLGHKGLLTAAKAIALAAIRTMEQPEKIALAKKETLARNGGHYTCPLPDSVKPPVGRY